jgi:hypothetical protein
MAVLFLGKSNICGSVVSTYVDQHDHRFHTFKYKGVKYRIDGGMIPSPYLVEYLKKVGN